MMVSEQLHLLKGNLKAQSKKLVSAVKVEPMIHSKLESPKLTSAMTSMRDVTSEQS